MVDQFSKHHLLKRLSFLHGIFLPPLSKMSIGAWIYLWAFCFVPLIYISVFVPVPYFYECVFVVEPQVREVDSSCSILLSQDCFDFLYFHTNCEIIFSSSVKNTAGSLIGIALNL